MKKVLIICTHNSCRSQIAEGLINHFLRGSWQAFSAGVEPTTVNPYAKAVLEEIGISAGMLSSKSVSQFLGRDDLDLVVTVCDDAKQTCPIFPGGVRQVHIGFSDPEDWLNLPEAEALAEFRVLRESIRTILLGFLQSDLRDNPM